MLRTEAVRILVGSVKNESLHTKGVSTPTHHVMESRFLDFPLQVNSINPNFWFALVIVGANLAMSEFLDASSSGDEWNP